MINDIAKYVEDVSGNIYKMLDTHFLKLSPWKENEDRRIVEIDSNNYHIIAYNNACMIINKQFDETKETWVHKGKNYIANVLNINTKDEIEEHSFKIKLLPDHRITLDDEGESELKLVKHKGKMYYILIINEKLPRVKAYNLFGKFCQWVGIQHCKPVFCETDNRYI